VKDKITILIADDNADFTTTLVDYLEKESDMEVIGIAKDGKEACEMVANTQPDILLLDVIMPYLDGLGVLEKIQTLEKEGKFDIDVEEDPPTIPLTPEEIDYLRKSTYSKLKNKVANKVGEKFLHDIIKERKKDMQKKIQIIPDI